MYLHKSLLNEVRIHICSVSLQCTWVTWSACWQNTVPRWHHQWSVGYLRGGGGQKKAEQSGSRLAQTQGPAYLVHPLFYWHSVHLISGDPCLPSPSAASLVKEQRPRGSERARPLPTADRALIWTRMSGKKPIKVGWWGKDGPLSW